MKKQTLSFPATSLFANTEGELRKMLVQGAATHDIDKMERAAEELKKIEVKAAKPAKDTLRNLQQPPTSPESEEPQECAD